MVALSDIMQGYMYDYVQKLENIDYFNQSVQFDSDSNGIASSDACFIFAGPPVLFPKKGYKETSAAGDLKGSKISDLAGIARYLRPIGAVQQYTLNSGRQVIPFKELGSMLKRHAVGSGQYNANLGRVLTRHSNLKWSLYSWLYPFLLHEFKDTTLALSLFPGSNSLKEGGQNMNKQWIGMDSDVFNIPFGLLVITGAADGRYVHIEYLERCMLPAFGRAYSAGNNIITPNVSIMVTRPQPFVDSNGRYLIPRDVLLKANKTEAYRISNG